MPDWPTHEQREEIDAIYAEARRLTKETDSPHLVDHIIPLKCAELCGLHVPWNLQVVPAEVDLKKGNKLGPLQERPIATSSAPG